MSEAIRQLYVAIRDVIDETTVGDHRETFAKLRNQLSNEPTLHYVEKSGLPVTDRWLTTSLAGENPRWPALSVAAQAALTSLRWQVTYQNLPPSEGLVSFQADYSWVPLVLASDEAPIRLDDALVGFTVQAPHTNYPGHHHKPVEIYGILSGEVQWKLGDGEWQLKRPGDVIVHRSHELHAMRTLDQPCLTWVAWDSRNDDLVYMPSLDPPGHQMEPTRY